MLAGPVVVIAVAIVHLNLVKLLFNKPSDESVSFYDPHPLLYPALWTSTGQAGPPSHQSLSSEAYATHIAARTDLPPSANTAPGNHKERIGLLLYSWMPLAEDAATPTSLTDRPYVETTAANAITDSVQASDATKSESSDSVDLPTPTHLKDENGFEHLEWKLELSLLVDEREAADHTEDLSFETGLEIATSSVGFASELIDSAELFENKVESEEKHTWTVDSFFKFLDSWHGIFYALISGILRLSSSYALVRFIVDLFARHGRRESTSLLHISSTPAHCLPASFPAIQRDAQTDQTDAQLIRLEASEPVQTESTTPPLRRSLLTSSSPTSLSSAAKCSVIPEVITVHRMTPLSETVSKSIPLHRRASGPPELKTPTSPSACLQRLPVHSVVSPARDVSSRPEALPLLFPRPAVDSSVSLPTATLPETHCRNSAASSCTPPRTWDLMLVRTASSSKAHDRTQRPPPPPRPTSLNRLNSNVWHTNSERFKNMLEFLINYEKNLRPSGPVALDPASNPDDFWHQRGGNAFPTPECFDTPATMSHKAHLLFIGVPPRWTQVESGREIGQEKERGVCCVVSEGQRASLRVRTDRG